MSLLKASNVHISMKPEPVDKIEDAIRMDRQFFASFGSSYHSLLMDLFPQVKTTGVSPPSIKSHVLSGDLSIFPIPFFGGELNRCEFLQYLAASLLLSLTCRQVPGNESILLQQRAHRRCHSQLPWLDPREELSLGGTSQQTHSENYRDWHNAKE